jgi:hypothetical protein
LLLAEPSALPLAELWCRYKRKRTSRESSFQDYEERL